MEPGLCLQCRREVHGRVNNIALTILCIDCITSSPVAGVPIRHVEVTFKWSGRQLIGKARVDWESYSRVRVRRPEWLDALRFEVARRDDIQSCSFERRYVAAEVSHLNHLRQRRLLAEIRLRKAERALRRAALERETSVNFNELDPYVRFFLLGDYLSGACYTTTQCEEVVQRCRVLPRVQHIMKKCKRVYPDAVFNFCLQYPTGGPKEFRELQKKTQLVFHQQGFRILDNLDGDEVERLEGTILRDVYNAHQQRDYAACVRIYLEPLVGIQDAGKITRNKACLKYIQWHKNRKARITGAVEVLLQFWKEQEDPEEKKQRLLAELESRGVSFPEDNAICEAYIHSTEVVLLANVIRALLLRRHYKQYFRLLPRYCFVDQLTGNN